MSRFTARKTCQQRDSCERFADNETSSIDAQQRLINAPKSRKQTWKEIIAVSKSEFPGAEDIRDRLAAATLFEAMGGWELSAVEKARLCQQAENQFVGVNCGILDQYTSCAGQEGCALVLDCHDLNHVPVPLPQGLQVVICDTRSRRDGIRSVAYVVNGEQHDKDILGWRVTSVPRTGFLTPFP